MGTQHMYAQMADALDRIAGLRGEIARLEELSAEVAQGQHRVLQQAAEQGRLASRAASMANVKSAMAFGRVLADAVGPSFQHAMEDNFGSVRREIEQGISLTEDEIRRLEQQIADLRRAIEEEQRAAAQRAADEARRRQMQRGGSA